MPGDAGASLEDILNAIAGVEAAVKGKSFEDFTQDWLIRHGVQRGIEIISEASRRLPDDLIVNYPEIPWKEIRGVGNVLRHEYHSISDRVIWNVVQQHLPPLRSCVEKMLETLDQGRTP